MVRWVVGTRWATLNIGGILVILAAAAHRASTTLRRHLRGVRSAGPDVVVLALLIAGLAIATTHADITPDTDSASLLGDDSAELSALIQARELLGAEDVEAARLDLHAEVERSGHQGDSGVRGFWRIGILVGLILGLLIQVEVQTVAALVTDGQIGEQEVASLDGTIEISHAGHGHTSENWRLVGSGSLDTAIGDDASMFQSGIEEEVGVILEGNVAPLGLLPCRTLEDAQLDYRRWINRTTVGRSCGIC
jgi:hypothetical protein